MSNNNKDITQLIAELRDLRLKEAAILDKLATATAQAWNYKQMATNNDNPNAAACQPQHLPKTHSSHTQPHHSLHSLIVAQHSSAIMTRSKFSILPPPLGIPFPKRIVWEESSGTPISKLSYSLTTDTKCTAPLTMWSSSHHEPVRWYNLIWRIHIIHYKHRHFHHQHLWSAHQSVTTTQWLRTWPGAWPRMRPIPWSDQHKTTLNHPWFSR